VRYAAVKFTSGGRIGHRFKDQITARIAASLFKLTYAHTPYPDHDLYWDEFLGFGEGEAQLRDVARKCRLVEIKNTAWTGLNLDFVRNITAQHPEQNTAFIFSESARLLPEQLTYESYDPIIKYLRYKYQNKRRIYPIVEYFDAAPMINIALHIRRGPDIDPRSSDCRASWRFTSIDYYKNIISNIRVVLGNTAKFHIYSQGHEKDFQSLMASDVKLHLVPYPPRNYYQLFQSFHHMCLADVFVTAVSAFSYFISWMNPNCIINLPVRDVVKLPTEDRFITSNKNGDFNMNQFGRVLNH